ncbi:MAG: sodium:solute symporter family protein [Candidatus Caenarcaniphilales bacterium]|nr:sodium:solute symporter family protein [Candidatus Caenarcaniphilales bacterium]
MLLIALFSTKDEKKNLDNFFLAGRKLTIPALVASLTTTWYGSVIGSAELAFNSGFANLLVQGFFWYAAALLFMIFLAPKINLQTVFTLPSIIANRFDDKAAILAALINLVMNNIAPYVLSLGLICSYFFHVEKEVAILVATAIPLLYTFRGSFQTVILTDIIQFFFMYLGPALLLNILYTKYGGVEFIQSKIDPELLQLNGNLDQMQIIAWGLLAAWTLVDPNFYQRSLAAVNSKSLRWSIFISIIFWFIFDMLITVIALYAKAIMPLSDAKFSLLDIAQSELGVGTLGVFIVAILSIIMSTIDSLLFNSGSIFAFDIYNRVKNSLFKSSAVQLRSEAPKVSLTIQNSYNNKHKTELLITSRLGILLSAAAGIYIAIKSESIIELLYLLGSLGVGSLLMPCLIALFVKRTWYHSRASAFYIMLTSFLSSLTWVYFNKIYLNLEEYMFDIEPIFVGLGISFTLFFIDILRVLITRLFNR